MSSPESTPVLDLESILETIKKLIGLPKNYDAFDSDIIVHINSVLSILNQMGIGPEEGFAISGYDEKWVDFTTSDILKTRQVRSYMALKVKYLFDPSSNSNVLKANERVITEMEYRLFVDADNNVQTPAKEDVDE